MRVCGSFCLAGVLTACLQAQTAPDVGSGSPNSAIQQAFINAWGRNGFNNQVVAPSGNVTKYGVTGLIQQFPSKANSKDTLALIKPDTSSNYNVQQMQAAMFAYFGTVSVTTAGYPTDDTLNCPALASNPTNSCEWQHFANNYVLFAYASPVLSGSQTFAVRAPFLAKWTGLGEVYGLGPATSAEIPITSQYGSGATVQAYDTGAIFNIVSGPLSGRLLAVRGPVYNLYLLYSANGGALGLPVTEELALPNGLLQQTFEGGAIVHDPVKGTATLRPAIANLALTPGGPLHMNVGDSASAQVTVTAADGTIVTDRTVSWNTSNGRVVQIQAKGLAATLQAVGGGTATVTVTAEGKTSATLSVLVSAPCCQVGEGAPTAALQQAFQDAVTRNKLSVQLPAGSSAARVGNGYAQQLLSIGTPPVPYLVAVPDSSSTGYVIAGAILAQYLALGGPAGALGYPQSDATPGGRQTFERGTLAGNPVQLVAGAILAKWGTLGYETGVAGPPTAAAATFQTFRGATGTMQSFQNGLILAPQSGQTFLVAGVILAAYTASGGPTGDLGAPTSDEHPAGGLRQQEFDGGLINYAPGSSAATVVLNPRQPLVTASPGTVLSGTPVHLVAGGFSNGATVRVSQSGQPDFVVTVASGSYSWDVNVPAGAPSGVITIRAADTGGSAAAQATYTVRNVSSAPLAISAVSGDRQSGAPGAQLTQPLVVVVQDQNGNPVPGQIVTFAASPGGQVVPASAVTGANGQAGALLRMPLAQGIALATAQAGRQFVTFSATSSAFSLTNFPALTQAIDGMLGNGKDPIRQKGALLTGVASILRYHQLRGELPQPNGLADPATLNQFLKTFCVSDFQGNRICDGFVSLGQSTEQTVNLWRVGAFAGNNVDVHVEPADLTGVRDLVAAGAPVLLALSLGGGGSHFVVAMGVAADGSLAIADPAFAQTSLTSYLNGFTATGGTIKGTLSGAVRLLPQPPASAGFQVIANQPFTISSPSGPCGQLLQFPDSAAVSGAALANPPGILVFGSCAGSAVAYQLDMAAPSAFNAAFSDLSPNGGRTVFTGTSRTSYGILRSNSLWTLAPLALSITPPGVVNGASYTSQIAPGSFISIMGAGLAGAGCGASVQINGEPVPVAVALPFQVNAQIPFDVAPGAATVTLSSGCGSAQQAITISDVAPAIFSVAADQAAITDQDNSLNKPSNPALRGDWIVIYATGFGAVSGSGSLRPAAAPVTVVIGGVEVPAVYAGLTPGSPFGLYQVNVQLPTTLPPGLSLPLYLKQGAGTSNTVTVSIQ
jgi:uncharacterized protein (TIGR03437 family)